MSIPDNPFGTADPSPESSRSIPAPSDPRPRPDSPGSTGSPVHAPAAIHDPAAFQDGAHTPSPARTPGGSVLHIHGTAGPTKNPNRHVQFGNESQVIALQPLRPPAPDSPEQTLSASNIEQVDTALERHISQSPQRSTRRRRAPREISAESSVDGLTTDDEDYDYRLDVDPPGTQGLEKVGSADSANRRREEREGQTIQNLLGAGNNDWVANEYIPLGETDGLPNLPSVSGTGERDEHASTAQDLVRAHTGKWGVLRRRVRGAGHAQRAFGSQTQHHHLFHRHHEDEDETGTGETQEQSSEDPEKAAVGRERSQRSQRSPVRGQGEFRPFEMDDEPERIRRQSGGMPQLPGGGGASVLSSLLQLYNQRQLPESTAASTTSSRASSEDEYSSDESHRDKRPVNPSMGLQAPDQPNVERIISPNTGEEGIVRQPLEVVAADEIQPEPAVGAPPQPPPNTTTSSFIGRHHGPASGGSTPSTGGLFGYFRKAKDEVAEKIEDADRPVAAKSGAGVFGALLQSIANVSGVATPAASALAPAARRSGFQLNRFAIPEATELPSLPKRWRPPSSHSSRNNSRPPSIHSATPLSRDSDGKGRSRSGSDETKTDHSAPHKTEDAQASAHVAKRPKPFESLSLGKIPGAALQAPGHALKSAEKWITSKTPLTTPPSEALGEYFLRPLTEEERHRREWERERRRKRKEKKARKKQEIFVS